MIIFLAAVTHFIFIDHTPEYPWQERCILIWTIGAPDPVYWMWVFGFPHNRQWKEIGRYVTAEIKNDIYSTNENKSIAGYYIPYLFDINLPGYYIHIMHPQSFRDRLADDKIRYWMKICSSSKPSKMMARPWQRSTRCPTATTMKFAEMIIETNPPHHLTLPRIMDFSEIEWRFDD